MTSLATTHDDLLMGRLTLEQPEKGYRFTTDTVLLAAALRAEPGETVLELGCGVGGALLTAATLYPECVYTGIEREAVYAELAMKNAERNTLGNRVTVHHGDIHDKALFKELGTFHHILANPPYFTAHAKNDVSPLRRVAREESDDMLANWLQAANRYLKPKGTVTFIHAADRLAELMDGMSAFAGNITVFPFYPYEGQAAKRVIVCATKGSKGPLTLLPGLALHVQGHNYYTERASRIIKDGHHLWQA